MNHFDRLPNELRDMSLDFMDPGSLINLARSNPHRAGEVEAFVKRLVKDGELVFTLRHNRGHMAGWTIRESHGVELMSYEDILKKWEDGLIERRH